MYNKNQGYLVQTFIIIGVEQPEKSPWAESGTIRPNLPLITSRQLHFLPKTSEIAKRQAWVETMDTINGELVGMVDLHPRIFAYSPHMSIIHQNVEWQLKYQKVVCQILQSLCNFKCFMKAYWYFALQLSCSTQFHKLAVMLLCCSMHTTCYS